jgi:hypothetical protein
MIAVQVVRTVHWQAADLIAWHTTLHLGRGVSKKTSPLKDPIDSKRIRDGLEAIFDEVGFGTGACLERVCVRKNIPRRTQSQ